MRQVLRQQVIFVIGMHRSGTSALSKLINILGFQLWDREKVLQPDFRPAEGYWEHLEVVILNEKLLAHFNQAWDTVDQLPENWLENVIQFKPEARKILTENFSQFTHWALKDPRMCKLLPFWLQVLQEFPCDIYFICILRNPLEVADSLEKRDHLSKTQGYLLWLEYNLAAEKATRNFPRVFVSYENLMKDPCSTLEAIEAILKTQFPKRPCEQKSEIEEFLTTELRHHQYSLQDIDKQVTYFPYLRELYELLLKNGKLTIEGIRFLETISSQLYPFRVLYREQIKLKNLLQQTQQQLAGTQNACQELQEKLNDPQSGYQKLQEVYEETQNAYQQLQNKHEQLQVDHYLITHSVSWRYTNLLRALKRKLKLVMQ